MVIIKQNYQHFPDKPLQQNHLHCSYSNGSNALHTSTPASLTNARFKLARRVATALHLAFNALV